MLDLGANGMVLHLFQCHGCGLNTPTACRAIVLHESQLAHRLTKVEGCDEATEYGNGLVGEARIKGWKEFDDGIPVSRLRELLGDFRTCSKLQDEFPQIEWFDGREATRFGGTPRWTGNGPMGIPDGPFEFLFQLDNHLYMPLPLPDPDDVGCTIYTFPCETSESREGISVQPSYSKPNAPWFIMHEPGAPDYRFEFTNLGSDGTLFVFIDRTKTPHEFRWFWNR
jgi:hypothetical protein